MTSQASTSSAAASSRRDLQRTTSASLQPPRPTAHEETSSSTTTRPTKSTFHLLLTTLSITLLSLPLFLALHLSTALIVPVGAQQPPQGTGIGQANNATSLRGTWSTGAGHVVTGLSFFNPANNTFSYPSTAGQAYSFTDDGHWEQALYLYQSMPGKPFCVTAQLIWQHGTYTINGSNYLLLQPFNGDGMQQVSSRCTQTSQLVQPYNQNETMMGFEIQLDDHFGTSAYYLKMYEFDGTPKPLMWKIYDPPQMLPTVQLKEPILNAVGA